MADQFTIPGLSQALAEWENLKKQINEASDELIIFARNAAEASKEWQKITGSADFNKMMKEVTVWTDKVEASTEKYNKLVDEQKKALENLKTAVANYNTQQQNSVNTMKLSTSQTSTLNQEVAKLTESENKNTDATKKNTEATKKNIEIQKAQKANVKDGELQLESYSETLKEGANQLDTMKGKFSEFQSVFQNSFSQLKSGDLTGAISTLITGFKTIFSVVTKLSMPLTLFIGVLALVKVAYQALSEEQEKNSEQWKIQQGLAQDYNEISQEVARNTDKRITKLKLLTEAAADETKSLGERMKALNLLIKEDEKYRSALVDGKIKTDILKKATSDLIIEILDRAKAESYMNQISRNVDKMEDIDVKIDELTKKRSKENMSIWGMVWDNFKEESGLGKSIIGEIRELYKERSRLEERNKELARQHIDLQGKLNISDEERAKIIKEQADTEAKLAEQKAKIEAKLAEQKASKSSGTSDSGTSDNSEIRRLRMQVMAYEAANNTRIMSDEEALEVFREIQRQKTEILDAQLKAGFITQETYNDRVKALEREKQVSDIQHRKNSLKEQEDYYTALYELDEISAEKLLIQKQEAFEENKKLLKQEQRKQLISEDDLERQLSQLYVKYSKDTANLKSEVYQEYVNDLKRQMAGQYGDLKFLNQKELESVRDMLVQIVKAQEDALAAKMNINLEELKDKIATNQELTKKEKEYLEGIENLHQKTAETVRQTINDSTEKTIGDMINNFSSEQMGVNDKVPITEAILFGQNGSGAIKEQLAEIENLRKEIEDLQLQRTLETDTLEIDSIDKKIKARESQIDNLNNLMEAEKAYAMADTMATAVLTGNIKGLIASIAQVVVMYAMQAYMKRLATRGAPLSQIIAVAIVGGLLSAVFKSVIAKVASSSSAYAKGTQNAPYTGLAVVDEKGAEIHTDKDGNVKSFGQSKGARLAKIERGDKIYPSPESKKIKEMFEKPIMFRYLNHLNFDPKSLIINHEQNFDYEKMSEMIARKMEKQERQRLKKNYVIHDGQIIVIEEKGGLTKYIRNEKKEDLPFFN